MRHSPVLIFFSLVLFSFAAPDTDTDPTVVEKVPILSHIVDPSLGNLRTYYQDQEGKQFNSFRSLKKDIENQGAELVFAANGGMYMEDRRPLGLYIESGEELRSLNRRETGHGNFYLQPNGVFLIHEDLTAEVCPSYEFEQDGTVEYATQSGPMLLVDGKIHSGLTQGSSNLHIRNGVGVLPDGRVIFAMSRELINFYDLATFFKEQGCMNALYLDGFVSRTYLPAEDVNYLGGNFGVIIAETSY